MHGRVEVGLVIEARPLEHARHEVDTTIMKVRQEADFLDQGSYGDVVIRFRPAARVVDEVHTARASHEVEGGQGERAIGRTSKSKWFWPKSG